jgi:hypothetical protein
VKEVVVDIVIAVVIVVVIAVVEVSAVMNLAVLMLEVGDVNRRIVTIDHDEIETKHLNKINLLLLVSLLGKGPS